MCIQEHDTTTTLVDISTANSLNFISDIDTSVPNKVFDELWISLKAFLPLAA